MGIILTHRECPILMKKVTYNILRGYYGVSVEEPCVRVGWMMKIHSKLSAAVSSLIVVPLMMMGMGVAHATPYVPMGHTTAGLPIYDLQETLARPEYSNVQIDTT